MKKIFAILILFFIGVFIFLSCKKEYSCEGCKDGNKPPIAVAGPDQVITLPTDSISLNGSASNDPDGTISEWLWTKISGPASFNIINAVATKTVVRNLDTGVYQFELTVKDNGGLSAKDTVQITFNDRSQPNRPPVAKGGTDQTITLPTNTITLNGNGSTDPDNNIASYAWTKISGPSSFNIVNTNTMQTQVNNLVQGVYQFELKVTDAGGLFSKDTVQINVNSTITSSCEPINRPIINAQLIPFGNLSQPRARIAAVSAGSKIFFAGGFNASGHSSRVDIYDITSQSWSTAELSVARTYITAVASGDKVFFAGGFFRTPTSSFQPSSRVDIYNLTTQSWSIAELSEARAQIVAATVGNKVFFAGGQFSGGSADISGTIDIYDISANAWSTASLSEIRAGFTATTANNKIYFAGGWLGVTGAMNSNKIDVYDNATGSWSVSTLSAPRAFHASIFKNGKIYWAGGWINGNGEGDNNITTCHVEIRDLNAQTSSFANLVQPNSYFKAYEKDNQIIFLPGSEAGMWTTNTDFDIFDVGLNSWSIGVENTGLLYDYYTTIVSANNALYVVGGGCCGNNNYSSQVWKLEF